MPTLGEHIAAIGAELVACNRRCEGVVADLAKGVVPRGLVLESRTEACPGAIFVGMNPGQGDNAERTAMRADASYQSTVDFLRRRRLTAHQYYLRLRALADASGFRGHLLWTELAKCQSAPDFRGSLPLETSRTCAATFLRREVEATPPSWPVFAIGRDAYGAAALLFSDRAVLGVAHPTGSWGNWHSMFTGGALRSDVRAAIERVAATRRAAWIAEEVSSSETAV